MCTSKNWRGNIWLFALALAATPAAVHLGIRVASAHVPATAKEALRVSLFPYVPNQTLIQDTIRKRWNVNHGDIPLEFVQFDPYKNDPPDDLDVFEFDAIGLDYYVRNGFVSPLSFDEVQESSDILDFAWKGSMVDGRVYGVPRLACTYVLIYRKGDTAITNAIGLQDLYKVLGDGPTKLPKGQTEPIPENGKGLLIDLSGGTDCACLYLDAFADVSGKYSVHPKLPIAIDLDTGGLNDLKLLARMAGPPQALFSEPYEAPPKPVPPPKRPAWFGAGRGRAFVGYSERLYFIPKEAHANLCVRDLPMADQHRVNTLFVDMLAVNAVLRGERRNLAIELANLCAAKDTVLECLMPAGDKPSQYLLPVRASVIGDKELLANAPLYAHLGKLLDTAARPRAFRMGPDQRDWLDLNKGVIKSRLFEK